jgi:hypothetical protein
MGIVASRASWREIFCGKRGLAAKKRKKEQRSLWKLTPLMEIRRERVFPQWLEKTSQTTLGFFTVPTGPTAKATSKLIFRYSSRSGAK